MKNMVVATIKGFVYGEPYNVRYRDHINNEEGRMTCRKFFVTDVKVYTPLDAQKELEKELVWHSIDVSPEPTWLRAGEEKSLMTGKVKRMKLSGGWLPNTDVFHDANGKVNPGYFVVHGARWSWFR